MSDITMLGRLQKLDQHQNAAKQPTDTGFTMIELVVVMSLVGILVATASLNFQGWTTRASDSVAQSDYRNLKVAITNMINDPSSPTRLVIRRFRGPGVLPAPLRSVSVSPDMEVSVFYQMQLRRNRIATTQTDLLVEHLRGSKQYHYVETNGVIVEQVIEKN